MLSSYLLKLMVKFLFLLIMLELKTCSSDTHMLAKANLRLSVKLYSQLRQSLSDDNNIVFSPIALFTALSMLFAGARGETKQQIEKLLELPDIEAVNDIHNQVSEMLGIFNNPADNYTMVLAARLFGRNRHNYLPQFLRLTSQLYGAPVLPLDIQGNPESARLVINHWVESVTRGHLVHLLPPGSVTVNSALLLVNAVYFQGDWDHPFHHLDTRQESFHVTSDKIINMDIMRQKNHFRYAYMQDLQCKVLELPYIGDKLSMFVILPEESVLLSQLEDDLLNVLENGLDLAYFMTREVKVKLPKFNLTFSTLFNDALLHLGMKDAFSLMSADFSGITGKRDTAVSDVVHKAYIDVSENGTKAAAATGIRIPLASLPPVDFFVNRPFMFGVKDKQTGVLVFLGRMVTPPHVAPTGHLMQSEPNGGKPRTSPGCVIVIFVILYSTNSMFLWMCIYPSCILY